jgi:hypothetical protein
MKPTESGVQLVELRFPPSMRKPYPSNLARGAGFALAAITALFTGGLALSQALAGAPIEGPGGLWGSVVFLGAISIFAALLSIIPLRIRGFRVQDGIMTLVTPVRAASGKRIRHVPLERIASAERITQPGADPGILVTLRDGTRFPVFDADLRDGGKHFLDALLAAVGQRGGIETHLSDRGAL